MPFFFFQETHLRTMGKLRLPETTSSWRVVFPLKIKECLEI